MANNFLGRWSQRKVDARQGKPLPEPEVAPAPEAPPPLAMPAQTVAATTDQLSPPPLTLQDAQALGKDSDFKPFTGSAVDPAVRNAAMKKLFTDPHFNVMDGLDTYIDDYSQPDPLPLAILQHMASAQFLQLVDQKPDATPIAPPTPDATPSDPTPTTRQDHHAHADLRLQPDHAAGPTDLGSGTA